MSDEQRSLMTMGERSKIENSLPRNVAHCRLHRTAVAGNVEGRGTMNCYRHEDRQAVGICYTCHKGVCSECAVEVEKTLACKNSCEQDVLTAKELIKRAKGSYPKSARAYLNQALFNSLGGIIFIAFGVYESTHYEAKAFSIFLFGAGCVLMLSGYLNYRTSKRMADVN